MCNYDYETVKIVPKMSELLIVAYGSADNPVDIGGLRFVFPPYVLGSFAEGPCEVDVPIEELFPFMSRYFNSLVGVRNNFRH